MTHKLTVTITSEGPFGPHEPWSFGVSSATPDQALDMEVRVKKAICNAVCGVAEDLLEEGKAALAEAGGDFSKVVAPWQRPKKK